MFFFFALCLQPEQYFDDDKHFPEFLYIFETLIALSNKHSTFIGSKEKWKGPLTLFGTTKVEPIHATQEHSQCNCMFDEYAKFVGETHKKTHFNIWPLTCVLFLELHRARSSASKVLCNGSLSSAVQAVRKVDDVTKKRRRAQDD